MHAKQKYDPLLSSLRGNQPDFPQVLVQQTTGQNPLLKDFTGQIGATSSDIYQNDCLYVQLQNPVDDIVADEY